MNGDPRRLKDLAARLRALPKTAAIKVAAKSAPAITALAQSAYDGGTTVYGGARPSGKSGALSLVATGRTRATLRFVAVGSIVRVALGTRYARFLIGKYGILPMATLPTAWGEALGRVSVEVLDAEVRA
jgi:hypothetical protein